MRTFDLIIATHTAKSKYNTKVLMTFKLSARSKERRDGVDPKLIELDDLALSLTLIDFGHPDYAGLRDAEEQLILYKRGVSQCDGYKKVSKHQSGKALDFYAYVNGRASWDPEHLAIIATAYFQAASILGYKIRWGGLWKKKKPTYINGIPYGWDMGHIELID